WAATHAPTNNGTTLPATNVRDGKIDNGNSGFGLRRSWATKAVRSAALATNAPRHMGDVQPSSTPAVGAYTSAAAPAVTKHAPAMSRWDRTRAAPSGGRARRAMAAAPRHSGTLT